MKYLYLLLSWSFGIFFVALSLATAMSSIPASIAYLLIALFLLPPSRKFAYSKTKKEVPIKARGIIITSLAIASLFLLGMSDEIRKEEMRTQADKERAEKIAFARQKNIDYFNQHSSSILEEIKTAIADKKFNKVLQLSSKYLPSNNKELSSLHSKATLELKIIADAKKEADAKAERIKKTKDILAILKRIPSSQYKDNMGLYKKLVAYNPNNKKYKEKLEYYSKKVQKQEIEEQAKQEKVKAERAARIAKFGEAPIRSAWDGSYSAVERYLEKVANDPDSIKVDNCTGVSYTKKGWLVGCDYRGRNGFGGMVKQSNWFTIAHNRVIKVDEASAYRN